MAQRFDHVRLEKGMYHEAGRSFTQVLEKLDPSEQYRGTALEGLDAYQRQLKRFDIRVKGAGSDLVDKFFSTSQSAVLFPEYIARAVKVGMEEANILPDITATQTVIEGMDYRSITSAPEDEKQLKQVAEGAAIPQTTVRTRDSLVKLHKRGRMLVASYEAIRFQRLDLFTVALRQIGGCIARSQLEDAVDTLINGDGSEGSGAEILETAGAQLAYGDLVKLWEKFDGYRMDRLLASPDMAAAILNLPQMSSPAAGLNFQATGRLGTPLGAVLLKSSAVPSGTVIALDSSCALEMAVAGDVTVDYDRLMDCQLERAAVTSIAGFAKLFPQAVKVLSLKKATGSSGKG